MFTYLLGYNFVHLLLFLHLLYFVHLFTGITFSFIWVSQTSYTAVAIPSASLATIQGIMHGVYFGLGDGIGHFLGGVMIGKFGAVTTFYSFAVATAIWLLAFIACQKICQDSFIIICCC